MRENCTSGSEGRAEVAAKRSAASPDPTPAGIVDGGWEGPNAKPSAKTFVLVIVALTAANPFGGLSGRDRG